MKKFDYEKARKRVEKLTGKPTYLIVEGDEEKNREVEKPVERVELWMKANPDKASSTLRVTKRNGVFEEQINYYRGQKREELENRFMEIEDVKTGETEGSYQLEQKQLELDKQEREAKAKQQAALIDAEKYKHQVEEVRKQRGELGCKQEQSIPLVYQLPKERK